MTRRYEDKADVLADSDNLDKTTDIANLREMDYRVIIEADKFVASDDTSDVWGSPVPTDQDAAINDLQEAIDDVVANKLEEVLQVTWDQSADGNLTTAGVELGAATDLIPDNAIITQVIFDKQVATTGGTGDIKIKVGAVDLSDAIGTPGSTGVVDETLAVPPKTASEDQITIYSATTAYTAGKIEVFVKYVTASA